MSIGSEEKKKTSLKKTKALAKRIRMFLLMNINFIVDEGDIYKEFIKKLVVVELLKLFNDLHKIRIYKNRNS